MMFHTFKMALMRVGFSPSGLTYKMFLTGVESQQPGRCVRGKEHKLDVGQMELGVGATVVDEYQNVVFL